MIELSRKNGEPLHVQARELIREKALNRELVDGEGRLRTEQELVKYFGVSRVTIRNALSALVNEGLLVRTAGKGTFIKPNYSENFYGRLLGFQELAEEEGCNPTAEIKLSGMTKVQDPSVRDVFSALALWELRKVRFADNRPVAIEHAFYPPDIGIELETQDLTSIKMYRYFEDNLGITIKESKQTIGAKISSPDEMKELNLAEPMALVFMERLTVSADERSIELLRSLYRPDIFQLTIDLSRITNQK